MKGDTDVEPQKPSGSQPPGHSEPGKTESTSVWISPRLRDKLGDEDPKLPREKEGPPAWLGIVLLLIVLAGGGALLFAMRASGEKQKADAAKAAQQAVADSIAKAQRDSVMMAAARDTSLAKTGATAAQAAAQTVASAARPTGAAATAAAKPIAASATTPKPAAARQTDASAASAPAPASTSAFGISVASFIVEDRANSEQSRLASATGMSGRVVSGEDGSYSVVLGSFRSRAAAERAAEPLLAKGLVNEARVVTLKP